MGFLSLHRFESIMIGGFARLSGKLGEDTVEHAQPAPADDAVVDGLAWPVALFPAR